MTDITHSEVWIEPCNFRGLLFDNPYCTGRSCRIFRVNFRDMNTNRKRPGEADVKNKFVAYDCLHLGIRESVVGYYRYKCRDLFGTSTVSS